MSIETKLIKDIQKKTSCRMKKIYEIGNKALKEMEAELKKVMLDRQELSDIEDMESKIEGLK
jgi:hypothetical protein